MHRNSAVHFFADTEKTLVFAFSVPYNRGVPRECLLFHLFRMLKRRISHEKTYIFAFGLLTMLVLTACGGKSGAQTSTDDATDTSDNSQQTTAEETAQPIGQHHAQITIKDHGTIDIELDGDAAPISVQNFIDLANDGFYDRLTFHRIITGFMMQGGDPLGNGTGGSENTIKGEFSENGVENKLSHTRGAVSMARSSDPDSASSQFFIVQQDSTYLDGQYACFGYVTKGMDVVDEICDNTPVEDDNGTVKTENQPVIESIKIID